MGTKYSPPECEVPCEWDEVQSTEFSQDSPDCYRWWESFNDPLLNSLIEEAAKQNLDLHLAMTRILEARIIWKGAKAGLLPHVDGSITYTYANYNQKVLDEVLGCNHSCNKHRKGQKSLNLFEAGFDAEWELDLFGMNKHKSEALEARSDASQEDFSNAWVSLSAEIARSYIELRGLQQRLKILEQNIWSHWETKGLTSSLMIGGFAGLQEERQADEELSMLLAEKPQLEFMVQKNIHHLSILLGYFPRELICRLNTAQQLPCLPSYRPIGIPSELLRRRPDIRKAEKEVEAATAEIGVAIAAMFPRISLTGFIGDIATACTKGSFLGFGGPQVLLPIFNSKMLQDDVCLNKIKTEQALLQYQKTVLEALEEAENAIAAFHFSMQRTCELERQMNSSQEYYHSVQQLYETGLKNYLEVELANRRFLAAQEAHLQGQVDLLLHYISLYKALGGGWDAYGCLVSESPSM